LEKRRQEGERPIERSSFWNKRLARPDMIHLMSNFCYTEEDEHLLVLRGRLGEKRNPAMTGTRIEFWAQAGHHTV
jgi:hypothetical protein